MKEIRNTDKDYPLNLVSISSAPKVLYVNGSIKPSDSRAIAIVGTRTPTVYGKEVAEMFARDLVKAGFTIVSGMARGIDSVAHRAAIKSGGRTIAVLANGLDIIYPPENADLYNQIVANGAVVSEFKSGTRPLPKYFLARNRIVSGLSLAVIVIEGRRRSGTLSTATHAAEQGREVFAVPGPVNSEQSEAPLYLIEQGANIAKSSQDILDSLG